MTTDIPTIPSATLPQEVPENLMARYGDLIYKVTGIRISPQKKALLANRLRRRLRATGIKDFEAYFSHLKKLDVNDAEWDRFLQEITTHETFLFRDEAHWQWFGEQYLPELSAEARRGERRNELRIWSAACSTGDEAYSAATCIAAKLANHKQWNVKIVGTDIGIGAIEQANSPRFGKRAMRLVPEEYQRRFFEKLDDDAWQPKPVLSEMVDFRRHNLLEALKQPAFDLVFLKNVLIYFDGDSKRVVVDNVRKVMRPGTFLVAGAAEGISDLLKDLQRIHPWLYRKQ